MMPLDQVLPPSATVTSEGHLSIGGGDPPARAQEHGAPLVVHHEGAPAAVGARPGSRWRRKQNRRP